MPGDRLEITLSRAGAILLGLAVDPSAKKYKPIILRGEQAAHAARYIIECLRNGVSPELFHDATGIDAAEASLVDGPLGRVVKVI